jgi:hypothetical protein
VPIERTRKWMLGDNARTMAISDAVQRAIVDSSKRRATVRCRGGEGAVVACVGGGSGLCMSAAALSSKCDRVISVEWTAEHADAVRAAADEHLPCADEECGEEEDARSKVTVVEGAGDLANALASALKRSSGGAEALAAPAASAALAPAMDSVAGAGVGEIDALVSEPFFVPLAEGRSWIKGHALLWWWSVHSVRNSGLLAPGAVVWPAAARLRGALVSFERLWDATRPVSRPAGLLDCSGGGCDGGGGLDLSPFASGEMSRACAYGRSTAVWQHSHTVHSETFDLLTLEFACVAGEAPPPVIATLEEGVAAIRRDCPLAIGGGGGAVNAVVMWLDFADSDGAYPLPLSTGPAYDHDTLPRGRPVPWTQAVYFLESPLSVTTGGGVLGTVHASLDTLSGGLEIDVRPPSRTSN